MYHASHCINGMVRGDSGIIASADGTGGCGMDIGAFLIAVVAIGVASQWLAGQLKVPDIVPLIIVGLIVGPILGWIVPSSQIGPSLEPLIGIAVSIILFEGGLRLRLREYRQTGGVHRVVAIGVPVAFALGTGGAHFIGGLSWPVSTVFGAISVVTGPTVVLPMLRHAMLNRRIAVTLKWEAILNDPIGVLLAVLVFQFWTYQASGSPAIAVVGDVLKGGIGGIVIGLACAAALGWALRRQLVASYLVQPVTLAIVLVVYIVANHLQPASGLLATTVMGMVLGNLNVPWVDEMRRFKEYLSTILVSSVFILLSANLKLSHLAHLSWSVALVIPFLLLVVRPITVLVSTYRSELNAAERLLAAWAAPRGIVAAATCGVLGPSLYALGYKDGLALEPLMFGLIFVSVVLQGGTLAWLARALGLAAHARNRLLIVGAHSWTIEFAKSLLKANGQVLVVDTDWQRLSDARLAGVPVYYGEILSEQAEASLELSDVGMLLAATPNDAYNALVCTSLSREFGHENVFQLAINKPSSISAHQLMRPRRGRIAFKPDLTYEQLLRKCYEGWRFQNTTLTEKFDYAEVLKQWSDQAVTLAVVRSDGGLKLAPASEVPLPSNSDRNLAGLGEANATPSAAGVKLRPGDVMIGFVPGEGP